MNKFKQIITNLTNLILLAYGIPMNPYGPFVYVPSMKEDIINYNKRFNNYINKKGE